MKANKFVMPPIEIGDPVVWRHTIAGDPAAGVVTAKTRDAISVMVFPPESRVGSPRDVVRHVDDPQIHKMAEGQHDGVWDYTFLQREIMELRADVDDLMKLLNAPEA